MARTRNRSLAFVLACVLMGSAIADAQESQPASRLLGTASCAAAGCHGGLKHPNGIGGEYSAWLQRDPHSRAYSVLFNDLSREMTRNLSLPKPAHESAVCLNCHSPTTAAAQGLLEQSKKSARVIRGDIVPHRELPPFDGVGCEQCHGPAEHWAAEHAHPRWKKLTRKDKTLTGFRDLRDLLTRTRACIECHVGSAGKDVNHDLIAAGHPRLFFEMSAYHSNLPKHWNVAEDWKRQYFDVDWTREVRPPEPARLEANLWMIGQVASAEATVRLTRIRAELAEARRGPWPELAEWNCFACHHDLQGASWRQSRASLASTISQPTRNAWPFVLLDFVPKPDPMAISESATARLAELHARSRRPVAAPREVLELANQAARPLHDWATQLNEPLRAIKLFQSSAIQSTIRELCGEAGERHIEANWDSATQVYLALSALREFILDPAASKQIQSERDSALSSMAQTLSFPEGFNSPREFTESSIKQLQTDLQRLRKLLDAQKTTR